MREDALNPDAIAELQGSGIRVQATLRIGLKSLTANKLRTLLTALGIIIGVAAVVALMAIGRRSQASITATITANGANLLTMRPGASSSGGIGGQIGSGQTLTTDDATALTDQQSAPDISLVSPEYNGNGQANDSNSVTPTLSEIQQILRERHDLPANGDSDDFSVIN